MTTPENTHEQWIARETQAEEMIPLIGKLNRENGVVLNIHGRSLVNKSVIQLLRLHDGAAKVDGTPLNPEHTLELVQALFDLNLGPCSINIAALHRQHVDAGSPDFSMWLPEQVGASVGKKGETVKQQDVVLYGFGRIGRLLARILLARDSVHGPFKGTIKVDAENDTIIANGLPVRFIYSSDPTTVDYTEYGIEDALLVDNTGRWRDVPGLTQHLERPGISRVLLTAPGKGDMKNIVFGVNDSIITDDDKILSAASCTTNAITPALKVLDDVYGVERGHVETVHAFTNDQNLIDNFHKGDRRGRSAVLNMVITETGAARAVSKALPQLEGKLTGNAIRVPTPDVSMAILNVKLAKPAGSKDELNEVFRQVALKGELRRQIGYSDSHEAVSTDFVGSRNAGVVDALATVVTDDSAILYVWYDNEFGYSCQVVRVLERLVGEEAPSYPAQ